MPDPPSHGNLCHPDCESGPLYCIMIRVEQSGGANQSERGLTFSADIAETFQNSDYEGHVLTADIFP